MLVGESTYLVGLREYMGIGAANGAEAALATGDWEWAQAALDDVYDEALPGVDRIAMLCQVAAILSLKGNQVGAREKLSEMKDMIESMSSPEEQASVSWAVSIAALAEGRLDDAHKAAVDSTEWDPIDPLAAAAVAARAALWSGELAIATGLLNRPGLQPGYPMRRSHRLTIEAGIAALQGHLDDARSLYRQAFDGWRALGAVFSLALAQLDLVLLAGPDDPRRRPRPGRRGPPSSASGRPRSWSGSSPL